MLPKVHLSRRALLLGGGVAALGAVAGSRLIDQGLGDQEGAPRGPAGDESSFVGRMSILVNDLAAIDGLTPVASARFAAYAMLACNACYMGPAFLGQAAAAPDLPQAPPALESAAAATAALSVLLPTLMGTPTPAAWATIRNELTIEAALHADGHDAASSSEYGVQLGLAIAQWAAADGFFGVARPGYRAQGGDSHWRPESAALGAPLDAMVGAVARPLFISSTDRYLLPAVNFDLQSGTPYRGALEEVYEIGRNLTEDQKAQAHFWSDGRFESGTVAGHWLVIAGRLGGGEGSLSPSLVAATLAGAMYDALLACWHTKFTTDCARPRAVINDHVDAAWTPLLPTPNFPEFTSGHSAASGAASQVLSTLMGERVPFSDRPRGAGMPIDVPERRFLSFREAASQAADSRMLGGVHFRPACESGMRQGEDVANSALLAALSL